MNLFPQLPVIALPAWAVSSTRASLLAFASSSILIAGPVVMTGVGSYSQNFDSLPATGTGTTNVWENDVTLPGWYAEKSLPVITPAISAIVAGTGSSTGGGLYSFGTALATERALGSLGSGTPGNFAYGVLLQNTSSGPLLINSVSYTGEQWRNGGNTASHSLTFTYSSSATPITSLAAASPLPPGWNEVFSLDFTGPIPTATAGALDGNDPANRTAITNSPNILVVAGGYVFLRWHDPNDAGSDHGLAIDDLSISWVVPTTPILSVSALPTNFLENAGPSASTGTVSIPTPLPNNLVVSLSISDDFRASVPASVTILAGQLSQTFLIRAEDDLLANGNQILAITATASGYLSGQQNITVENDGDTPIVVAITPLTFLESAGANVATGTVTLAAPTPVALDVELVSLDETEATVSPSLVTIPANGTSANFTVSAIDDTLVDGDRTVTIEAIADNYTTGEIEITVQDDGDSAPAATLPVNAIAFTGYGSTGDDFLAFVVLSPIAAGDVILFTDNEWNGLPLGSTGKFIDSNEGLLTWTAPPGGVAVGTIVNLSSLSFGTPEASIGTITDNNRFNLSTSGADSVYAFQGAELAPTRVLAAITAGLSTTPAESLDGTGLTEWVVLPTGINIAAYKGARTTEATFAGYLPLIFDEATNWITQDSTFDDHDDGVAPDAPFSSAAFSIGGDGGNTYAAWATANATAGALPSADHDNDGVPNALEYFMGATGSSFTPNPNLGALGKIIWPKSPTFVGSYTVQTSSNLVAWTDVTSAVVGNTVEYTLTGPGPKFVRMKVVP